jgi:hypothetical protein
MKPKAIQKEVHCHQVDLGDKTYIFTFEPMMSQMVQSIRNIGLVHPPILAEISGQPCYRIISGLKRILALKHLRTESCTAIVYPDDIEHPNLDLFLMNFYENISTRELNPIEKSIALNKLITSFKVPKKELVQKYLPLMQLGANPKVLDSYLPLIQLEDNLKIAVVEDFLSQELAIQLLEYSYRDRQSLYELFSDLKLGKNRQKEFLKLLHDIAKIVNTPIHEIISRPLIQSTLNDSTLTVSLKVDKIRDLFRKLRYPIFSQAEEKFNHLKKELKLPPNVSFHPPPFFENDKYSIEIVFKDQHEYDDAIKLLKQISEKKDLTKLENLLE